MNLANMGKMLKCAGGDDIITVSAQDDDTSVMFVLESKGICSADPTRFVWMRAEFNFFGAGCFQVRQE